MSEIKALASVVTIKNIEKLEKYDRIGYATFDEHSYGIIVGIPFEESEGFKVGDKAVFICADSIIPTSSHFLDEDIRKRCYSSKYHGCVIRNMKMAGVISQGIIFNYNILGKDYLNFKSGTDVTKILNIVKKEDAEFEIPLSSNNKILNWIFIKFPFINRWIKRLQQKLRGEYPFPSSLIEKSDQDNIQNLKHVKDNWGEHIIYTTIKLEGQSATFLFDKKVYKLCSRNVAYTLESKNKTSSHYRNISIKYNIQRIILNYYKKTGKWIAIQGEICGPNIQSNIYELSTLQFFIFRIKNLTDNVNFSWLEMVKFIDDQDNEAGNDLALVPLIEEYSYCKLNDILKEYKSEEYDNLAYVKQDGNDIYKYILDFKHKTDGKKRYDLHEGIVISFSKSESCKVKCPAYGLWFK